MPELPEVETIKRGLQKRIVGKKIDHIQVNWSKSFLGNYRLVKNAIIIEISRRGKLLQIDLDNKLTILNHLKMTGQLVFQSEDENEKIVGGHPQKIYNSPLPHKHTHVIFYFKDDSKLYFNDLRKFGYMKLVNTNKVLEEPFINKLGIDAMNSKLTSKYLFDKLISRPKSTIFQALLDQTVIAGIGNIYANEVLFYAKILPTRKNNQISIVEMTRIITQIRRILNLSMKHGGTSDNTYRDIEGKKGNYLKFAAVYHKIKDIRGHNIKKAKLAGRSIFYCPICQK